MHVTFLTESLSSNSLGRTYCLWLLARKLGWTTSIVSVQGNALWYPLAGTDFAADVRRVAQDELSGAIDAKTDLLIACKPLPASFGLALRLSSQLAVPLLLDIDDPDIEVRMRVGSPLLAFARALRRPVRTAIDLKLRRQAARVPSIVSNPWLQARYGGTVIPHVRPDLGEGQHSQDGGLSVVFVGSPHIHKGIGLLREAVGRLAGQGFTLTVTANPPADAKAWERWVGKTSVEEGFQLTAKADIVALPSIRSRHALGQLPAKLVDAMMTGRAVVTSDVEPLPWALGGCGIVVENGSADALTAALEELSSRDLRARLGREARERALAIFDVSAVAPAFELACLNAMREFTR